MVIFCDGGSQTVVCLPLGVTKTVSWGPQGQNYFPNNINIICLFHYVDICTDATKAMVGKTPGALT